MNLALMAVEGVLAKDGSLAEQPPIEIGLRLYDCLRHQWRIALQADEPNASLVLHFLKGEGITGYTYAESGKPELTHLERMLVAIEMYKGRRMSVALVVDSDPEVIERALYLGIAGLLFTHPQFMRPESRPDWEGRTLRPWGSIVTSLEDQRRIGGGAYPVGEGRA